MIVCISNINLLKAIFSLHIAAYLQLLIIQYYLMEYFNFSPLHNGLKY